MTTPETDRYDVAAMKALAAQAAAFYHGLIENGMTAEQAMALLLAWVAALMGQARP